MIVAALIYLFVCFALGMLPTLIAWQRGHDSLIGILLVNLLLGWTGVGWVVALVWSVGRVSGGDRQVIVNNHVFVQGHQSTMETGLPFPAEPVMPMLAPLPSRVYAPGVAQPRAFGRRMG